MEIFGYISAIIMGFVLGLMGGGGAILTVPILVYLFGRDPVIATAYSLFIVGLTSLFGAVRYFRRGEVNISAGANFAIPSFVGVYLARAYVVPSLPDPVFSVSSFTIPKSLLIMSAFATLMVLASFSMIKKSTAKPLPERSHFSRVLHIGLQGFFVGGLAGFVGAGGGFLIIPALVVLVGLPMRVAVGTSLTIIAANSLLGFLGDLQHQQNIEWLFLLSISALALVGLSFGVSFAKRANEAVLKKAFGFFVLAMGSVILIDQLRKLFAH